MTPEERIAILETQVEAMQRSMDDVKSDVRIIRDTLIQAKGGWKTLMLVAGVAGSAGALLAKIVPFLPMR